MLKAAVTSAIQVHSCDVQMAPNLVAGCPQRAPLYAPSAQAALPAWLAAGGAREALLHVHRLERLAHLPLAGQQGHNDDSGQHRSTVLCWPSAP